MRYIIPQHIPFKPSQFPVPYSWVILMAAIVGVIMSIPGQTMGVSVFTDYLIEALAIDRFQLSNAYLIGTLASAMLLTKVGRLYDQYGGRLIAMGAALLMGTTLVLISFSDTIAQFLSRHIFGISSFYIPFLTITACFFLLRFSGQGVLTMVSRTMLMKWFVANRGFANGLSGVAVSFGFSVAPGILNHMIEQGDWKKTLWQLALLALGFVLFAFFFFRDNPESCGCRADGGHPLLVTRHKQKPLPERNYELQEVRRSYVFWVFTLTFMLFGLYVTAFTFHVADIFEKAGKTRTEAFSIFVPIAFVALFFHFFGSWLSDYIRLKYLLWLELVAIGLSAVAIIYLGDFPMMYYLLVFANGMFGGLNGILMNVSWPRFFGLQHLGAISGLAMSWNVAGSALGPALFSLAEQQDNSYTMACYAVLVLAGILFLSSLWMPKST